MKHKKRVIKSVKDKCYTEKPVHKWTTDELMELGRS